MNKIKSKVFVIALAICVLAVASLGTLAWFSDSDEVKNDFLISGSEDDPDDIFSVDVWEDATEDDTDPDEPKLDGIEFDAILPGDELYKEAHIQNTGSYDQYIRATVTITDAKVWQKVFGQTIVPLSAFVKTLDETAFFMQTASINPVDDTFVYELYYEDVLAPDDEFIVFEWANIPGDLDRFQAADLGGDFSINVVADAVQTKNVGDNVYEAFKTVGLIKHVSNSVDLKAALERGESIVLAADMTLTAADMITVPSGAKTTVDLNGHNITADFASKTDGASAIFTVDKNASLTVSGEGNVHAVAAPTLSYVSAIFNNLGYLKINGGNYSMTYGTYAEGYLIPTIVDTNSNIGKATTVINGGTFTHTRNMFRNFAQAKRGENNATLIINDGTFKGQADDFASIWNQKTSGNGVEGDGLVFINGGNFEYVDVENDFETGVTIVDGINLTVK